MEGARSKKRARRAGESESANAYTRTYAYERRDAPELSALERLHPDIMEVVLQQLGAEAASRLRPVSKKMREVVEGQVWRSLRVKASTSAQLESAAACIVRSQQTMGVRSGSAWIRLAASSSVELRIEFNDQRSRATRSRLYKAISALFAACSESSGGLGGVSMVADICPTLQIMAFEICDRRDRMAVSEGVVQVTSAMLEPLGTPEAEGGSCSTLRSIRLRLNWGGFALPMGDDLVQLLSRFPRLEKLQLPYALDDVSASIPSATPALRSAFVRFWDGAALAGLASHPALEELEVSIVEPSERDERGPAGGFADFAESPAARRLRKLIIDFGWPQFDVMDLPALGHLTSLETLELSVSYCEFNEPQDENATPELSLNAFLGCLPKLRDLKLTFLLVDCGAPIFRCLSRAFAGLSEHRLVLSILGFRPLAADAALAAMLQAAGPILVDLVIWDPSPLGRTLDVLADCSRLRKLRMLGCHLEWLLEGARGALAGLPELRELDLHVQYSPLGAAHLRGLADIVAALRARSLVALGLKIAPNPDPEADAALAGLLRAAGPALASLGAGPQVLRGAAAGALAACTRLRELDLSIGWPWKGRPETSRLSAMPIAEVVEAVVACPRIENLRFLPVAFNSEREAAELSEPLRRLAEARRHGHSFRNDLELVPGAGLTGEERERAVQLAKRQIRSIFPETAWINRCGRRTGRPELEYYS